jgi:hypothetical protein
MLEYHKVSDEIGILLHTIETHDAYSTFSMRKYVFDEKIGCNAHPLEAGRQYYQS